MGALAKLTETCGGCICWIDHKVDPLTLLAHEVQQHLIELQFISIANFPTRSALAREVQQHLIELQLINIAKFGTRSALAQYLVNSARPWEVVKLCKMHTFNGGCEQSQQAAFHHIHVFISADFGLVGFFASSSVISVEACNPDLHSRGHQISEYNVLGVIQGWDAVPSLTIQAKSTPPTADVSSGLMWHVSYSIIPFCEN